MNEAEWLNSTDVDKMLKFVRDIASDRKLHLFASACIRQMQHMLPNDAAMRALELSEDCADGETTQEALEFAAEESNWAAWDRSSGFSDYVYAYATEAIELITHVDGYQAAACVSGEAAAALVAVVTSKNRPAVLESVRSTQCDLLRCIVGTPWKPPTLARDTIPKAITRLAQGMYQDNRFDRMTELGRALRLAGGDLNAAEHCSHSTVHVRGCWVVDEIVGKR